MAVIADESLSANMRIVVRQTAKRLVELVSDKKFVARLAETKANWRNPFEAVHGI